MAGVDNPGKPAAPDDAVVELDVAEDAEVHPEGLLVDDGREAGQDAVAAQAPDAVSDCIGREPDVLAQLRALTARIDALVDRTQKLADENRALRQQHEQISGERSQLLAKNEQARSRVEAMIARLKSLEQHT